MIGKVTMERMVLMTTSSEAEMGSPPYFSAKRPRLVAVGRAWMRTRMFLTSAGAPRR